HGRIEQFDTPAAVLGAPATPYVADFVGADRGARFRGGRRRAAGVVTAWGRPGVPCTGPR
ncbi:hypothetical protein ACWEP3_07800, partial [Streptomyces albidoflavus]